MKSRVFKNIIYLFFLIYFPYELSAKTLIFITLDGVRHQEFFHGVSKEMSQLTGVKEQKIFTKLHRKYGKKGTFQGNHQTKDYYVINTPYNKSLPSYLSMFLGETSSCTNNICTYAKKETVFEKLYRTKQWNPTDIAVFSSWGPIKYSVSQKRPPFFVSTGLDAISQNKIEIPTEILELDKKARMNLPPWGLTKWDHYTYALFTWYLKSFKPKFIYLGLGDSDEWAHRSDYPSYVASLKQYDQWLDEILSMSELGTLGKDFEVVITTDHGRGIGRQWPHHGKDIDESKYAFLVALGPNSQDFLKKGQTKSSSHNILRPLFESFF